jgi:hypothetical protein
MLSILASFLLSGMNMYVTLALNTVNKKSVNNAFKFLNFKC